MDLIFLSYLPATLGLFVLGAVSYITNPHSHINRAFSALAIVMGAWQLMLFFADTATSDTAAVWFLRLALFFGTPLGLAFMLFAEEFPYKNKKIPDAVKKSAYILTVLLVLFSLSDIMVGDIMREGNHVINEPTPLYTFQSLFIIIELLYGLYLLIGKYRQSNLVHKSQLRLVGLGMVVVLVANTITGLVFVILDRDEDITPFLTSISLLLFSLAIFYSVSRKGMFSIKNTVARSVAYIVTFLVVAGSYTFALLFLIDAFSDTNGTRIFFSTAGLGIAVASYMFLKPQADKLTNKIFYQEAYSTREAIDRLTTALVSNTDLNNVISKSRTLVKGTVKAANVTLVIFNKRNTYTYGTLAGDDVNWRQMSKDFHGITVLDVGKTKPKQRIRLKDNGIVALGNLQSSSGIEGVLIVGHKASGGVYTKQDVDYLTIACKNIGQALNSSKSFDEISQFTKKLETRIRFATRELTVINKDLEESDRQKEDLISMASHQLRPNISAAKGFIDLLSQMGDDNLTKDQKD